MEPVNSTVLDAQLRHDVAMRRVSNATLHKIIASLNQAEREVVEKIRGRLGWIAGRGYDASDFTLRRLEANLLEIRATLREAYTAAGRELRGELLNVAKYEAEWQHRLLVRTGGDVLLQADIGVAKLSPDLLRAIVDKRPFQGGLLRDWARKLEVDAYTRLRGAVRQGMLQGETIDDIVRRVRGTRAQGYADGILELSRRDARAIVRTATSHVLNGARDEMYSANDDLVKGVQWVATLEAGRSQVDCGCPIRDGLTYDLNHQPIDHGVPWEAGPGRLHFNCRCTSVPVLKTWRELGIARADASPGTRASFNGQVPDRTTFRDWIGRQSAGVQDEVLGPTRGRALRSGEASFSEMFDERGRLLRLEDLAAMEDAA